MDKYNHKLIKYKQKYINLSGGFETYGEQYLKAIETGDCSKVTNLEDTFQDLYRKYIDDNDLVNRHLYLKKDDFSGKCGDYWERIPDHNLTGWRKIAIQNKPNKKQKEYYHPLPNSSTISKGPRGDIVLKLFNNINLSDIEKDLIREQKSILFRSRKLTNLFVLLLNSKGNFLRVLYYDKSDNSTKEQNIKFSYEDDDGSSLPSVETLFNISDIGKSNINECHLGSFFYGNPVTSNLRLEIVELLKTGKHRFKYWTSWILGSLINLIVHCFNCRLIHLYDVSQFDRVSRRVKFNSHFEKEISLLG